MKQVMVKRVSHLQQDTDRIGGSIMYENDNFSGYGTGNEIQPVHSVEQI